MFSQTRKRPDGVAGSYVAAILLSKIVRPYGIWNFACKVTNMGFDTVCGNINQICEWL